MSESDATDRVGSSLRLTCLHVDESEAELAADRLWTAGARSVEEVAGVDDRVELRAVLGSDSEVARRRLGPLPDGWELTFSNVDPRPAETWRQFAQPVVVDERLVIRPSWCAPSSDPDVLDVAIEPAGSFGLGDHPTTRLSAGAVLDLVASGDRVLDVGCGSGVLSIIAARRGAAAVVATDIAEAAREASIDNARRNGVQAAISVSTRPLEQIDGTFDLVVANILAPTLVALAPELRRLTKPSGRLVISGVLVDAHDHVLAALEPMCVVETQELDGWVAVTLSYDR